MRLKLVKFACMKCFVFVCIEVQNTLNSLVLFIVVGVSVGVAELQDFRRINHQKTMLIYGLLIKIRDHNTTSKPLANANFRHYV